MDRSALERALRDGIQGEVRFDRVSRALYSTDASVYQIEPLGVVLPRSRDDLLQTVAPLPATPLSDDAARRRDVAGRTGDRRRRDHRHLEVPERHSRGRSAERWVRVEPGVVLDELNTALRPHGLRFAPDMSTASRATIGGMMANNSSGARSVLYGKTIDHVLAQELVLADGSVVHARAMPWDEARRLAPRPRTKARATAPCPIWRSGIATRSGAAFRKCCAASAATTSTSSSTRRAP